MKKLMFMLAAVAMAASVHAGSVSWSTVTMYNEAGSKIADAATVYVYLLANAEAYTSLTDVWATYGDDVKAGGTTADASKGTGKYTHKATSIYAPADTADANKTYYAAIIATYGTGDDMKYYAEKASVTTGDDGNGAYTTFGAGHLDTATAAASSWTAATSSVPEPTSGLLMLVGLAGLALRRGRRA